LPLALFLEHLVFLREQQFTAAELASLRAVSHDRSTVLTFDDGLARQYELAFPALQEQRMPATFFVTTSLVETPGYMTWSQLREMSAAGMTIGSHGDRHIDYTGLTPQEAEAELLRSRLALEDALGKEADTFSAPYGFIHSALRNAARRAGFRHICSSRPWLAAPADRDIPRLAVYKTTGLDEFSALALRRALPILTRRTRDALLHLPKQFLLHTSPQRLGVNVSGGAK
jgi:peptidoglycan/xylan/chitin deacetylase (PgdA/CDA1 family)